MESILSNTHHSIVSATDVVEICQPLFTKTNIVNYVYARIFDNYTCYSLVANANHHIHHFEKRFAVSPPIPKTMLTEKIYYFLTGNENIPFQQSLYDARSLFNMSSPFFIIDRNYGYYDLHIFFSDANKDQMINYYLNNIDCLEKFNSYFKEKANKLLTEANKHILNIPIDMRPTFGGLNKAISDNGSCVNFKSNKQLLTVRENQCIEFLSYGFTMKEIAKEMKISPRTVEDYLNNLKIKLGVRRKSEIINALIELRQFH